MLRARLQPSDPRHLRRRPRALRGPHARSGRRHELRGVPVAPGRARPGRRRHPPRRPRPLPLLRGARAPICRARLSGGRDRLLRPHCRRREAGRRLPLHGPRRADDARRGAGGHTRSGRASPEPRGRLVLGGLHRRLLLRRQAFVALRRRRPRRSQGRSASTAIPGSGTASPARRSGRASSRRRSSGCRRATTRTSSRRTTRPSTRR